LHNIRSTYNVGSIFRTADAAGVKKIYLTGYTPAPIDRFGLPRKDIAKVALSAERTMP
jgi:tRNA G18 (ribose-2'-O)-methylase SpoU